MGDLKYSDDASLQAWGRNLSGAGPAAEEVAAKYAAAAEAARAFEATFGKIAAQAENDLPTSNRLKAEVDALHAKAKQATTPEAWRAIASECETLPAIYRFEHETDEDRLDAPRGSRQREKRADVSAAEQDT